MRRLQGLPGRLSMMAVLRHGAANTLRQRARGLEPGKVYSLSFISGDAERLRQLNHQKGEINCTIEGAELLDEYTEHSAHSEKDRGNYDKLVFKALRPDPLISFSDEKTAVGKKSYLSCVSLMPYFVDKQYIWSSKHDD